MSLDLLAAFLVFASVTLITPGPNNLMLMSSGLTFGLARTLPHLTGVALGFALMTLLVGIGFGRVFTAYPALYAVLKYCGAAYLIYLAWLIARAGPVEDDAGERGRPLTFLQAAAFQWVNPKAWAMAVGAVTSYAAVAAFPWNMILIAGSFGALGFLSSGLWAAFGQSLRRLVTSPRAVRVFNVAMALLLVASLYPVLM